MDIEDYSYGDTVAITSENGVVEAQVIDVDDNRNRLTLDLE